jgi:hypothetical protein
MSAITPLLEDERSSRAEEAWQFEADNGSVEH